MIMPPMARFKRLDVRPLLARGEEPLSLIRARTEALKTGDGLIIVAPFLPSPLIEKFSVEGFASKIEHGPAGEWIVYFWRA